MKKKMMKKKKIIISVQVATLVIFGSVYWARCGGISVNCTSLPAGIVSWWDGGNTKSTTARDLMAALNHGTMSSTVSLTSGRTSSAFNFSGNASSITIPNSSSLNISNSLTVAAWVKSSLDSRTSNSIQTILSQWGFQSATGFTESSNWQGVNIAGFSGNATDGTAWTNFITFGGGVFDGRYIYFSPQATTGNKFTRYDTKGSFASASSWQGLSLANFAGNINDGTTAWSALGSFYGGTFDGRYIYFPSASGLHSVILRYDTTGEFTTQANWQGIKFQSFTGAVTDGSLWNTFKHNRTSFFDGRYLYFAGQSAPPRVSQYDSQGTFTSQTSWKGVTLSNLSGLSSDGVTPWSSYSTTTFWGVTSDGTHIYFVPSAGGTVARYNTKADFTTASSWQAVNLTSFSGNATDSLTPWSSFTLFTGGAFDGRYIYLASNNSARFDTQGTFNSASSWQGLSIPSLSGAATDGSPWSGFPTSVIGMLYDGRYVYYIPNGGQPTTSYLARFDSLQSSFTSPSSWQGMNIAGLSGSATDGSAWSGFSGFRGGSFDGRYLYFAPTTTGANGGKFARFDTTGTQGSFALRYSDSNSDGLGVSLGGPSVTVNTKSGPITAQSLTSLSTDTWHHIATTYDGTTLTLYLDGVSVATQTGSAAINAGNSAMTIGGLTDGAGFFKGLINDVQLYNRALAAAEIQTLYGGNFCK